MLSNWLPMSPKLGPPLPTILGIYWPWHQSTTPTPETPEIPQSGVSIEFMADSLEYPVNSPQKVQAMVRNQSDQEYRMSFSYRIDRSGGGVNSGVIPVQFTLKPGTSATIDLPVPSYSYTTQGTYTAYVQDGDGNVLAKAEKPFTIY